MIAARPYSTSNARTLIGALLLYAASVFPALAADMVLEVVQLRYRTVEQVLPVIQPLVPRPGTVSGMQSSLIVRTTAANMAELRRVLDAVDRQPRRLMVTVRQDADARRVEESAAFAGAIGGDRGRIETPGERNPTGAVIEDRRGDARVRARVYGTQSLENDRTTQQLQVLEGNEAYIRIGQSVPVQNRSVTRSVIGGRVVERSVDAVEYRDILTGFHVRPRLTGDTVTLEVSPQHDTPGAQGRGSSNVQRASTTISGRLGEWLEVGGVVSGRAYEDAGLARRTVTVAGDNRRILIKVDEIP